VDLGREAPALVGDPGFPCLDEELGVQGGVLVEACCNAVLVRPSSAMVSAWTRARCCSCSLNR